MLGRRLLGISRGKAKRWPQTVFQGGRGAPVRAGQGSRIPESGEEGGSMGSLEAGRLGLPVA